MSAVTLPRNSIMERGNRSQILNYSLVLLDEHLTPFNNRAAIVLMIASLVIFSFHFVLGVAAGTQEGQVRQAEARAKELGAQIGSTVLHVGGPLLAGGVSIWIVNRIDRNQVNRSRSWLVGLVVAFGTFGLLFFA